MKCLNSLEWNKYKKTFFVPKNNNFSLLKEKSDKFILVFFLNGHTKTQFLYFLY